MLVLASLARAGSSVDVEVAAPAPSDPSSWLFEGPEIPEFALDLDPVAFDSLLAAPETWVEAGFTWQGVRYAPVGLRVKGENSFQPITDRPALKVQFDQYADFRFLGLDRLTLNNMVSDPTMMHERVSYWAYRELGIPASRSWYARLTVNGEDYGLYALLEDMDPDMLARWRPAPLATLYEMVDADFDATYLDAFELEFGVDDRAPLAAVADGIALGGIAGYAAIDAVLDWDEVIDYFAISAVVGQNDAYPYRYPGDDCHWYLDPVAGLQIFPHGLDEAFNPYGPPPTMMEMSGALPWFCLGYAPCVEDVEARIWERYDDTVAIGLYDQALATRDAILAAVALDRNRGTPASEVYAAQLVMLAYIADREAAIVDQVGPRP